MCEYRLRIKRLLLYNLTANPGKEIEFYRLVLLFINALVPDIKLYPCVVDVVME